MITFGTSTGPHTLLTSSRFSSFSLSRSERLSRNMLKWNAIHPTPTKIETTPIEQEIFQSQLTRKSAMPQRRKVSLRIASEPIQHTHASTITAIWLLMCLRLRLLRPIQNIQPITHRIIRRPHLLPLRITDRDSQIQQMPHERPTPYHHLRVAAKRIQRLQGEFQ